MRISPPILIVGFASFVAAALTASLFFLLPSPQEILRMAQANMGRLRTFSLDIDAHYGAPNADRRQVTRLQTSGQVDRSDPSAFGLRQRFTLTAGGDAPPAAGEIRRRSGKTYLRILGGDVWTAVTDEAVLSYLPFASGTAMDVAGRAVVAQAFRSVPLLRFVRKLTPERIDGEWTAHYEIVPDILAFKQLAVSVLEKRLGRTLSSRERSDVDSAFVKIDAQHGEAWIGERGRLFRRLALHFRVGEDANPVPLDISVGFSGFNAPVDIPEPEGPVRPLGSANALPAAAIGQQTTVSTEQAGGLPAQQQSSYDADGDGLTDDLERFYGTDPRNPDTDRDGMSDGDEVKAGRNPRGPGGLFDFGLPFGSK